MPYVIGRPPKRVLALVATSVGMLVAASPALADGNNRNGNSQGNQVPQVAPTPASPAASCLGVSSAPLLSGLGDLAQYAPVSGGTFEGSTAGWSFDNASVVSGNEPWNVVAPTDSNSLSITAGGSATSPTFCVDSKLPSFRLFANSGGDGRHSGLRVSARWTMADGTSRQRRVTTLPADSYNSWRLTPALPLGSVLDTGQTVTVQLVFSAGQDAGWNIDDVLLDPYAK